jgi:hypothetical protein
VVVVYRLGDRIVVRIDNGLSQCRKVQEILTEGDARNLADRLAKVLIAAPRSGA